MAGDYDFHGMELRRIVVRSQKLNTLSLTVVALNDPTVSLNHH